jgi:hypothetical protein
MNSFSVISWLLDISTKRTEFKFIYGIVMVYHHDIAEILLKVALNTIPGIVWTGSLYIQSIFNVCVEFKMLFITNILIDKDWTNIIQLLFGGLYLCDAFFFFHNVSQIIFYECKILWVVQNVMKYIFHVLYFSRSWMTEVTIYIHVLSFWLLLRQLLKKKNASHRYKPPNNSWIIFVQSLSIKLHSVQLTKFYIHKK